MKNTPLKRKARPRVSKMESTPKPRRKKSAKTKQEELLNTLWSEAVRTRDHYRCQVCGKETKMTQAHHIFSRVHGSTKWDIDNGITLCWACHMFKAHGDARGDLYWFIEHEWMGEKRYAALHEKAQQTVKISPVHLAEVEQYLRKEIRRLQDEVAA